MNRKIHFLMITALLMASSACSGPAAQQAASGHGKVASPVEVTEIRGRLIEARCYFNTGAIGGDHTLCAFLSAKANLPLGVLTAEGEFILVTATPSVLAEHVTRMVLVRGHLARERQLLRPVSMRVQKGRSWTEPIPIPEQ